MDEGLGGPSGIDLSKVDMVILRKIKGKEGVV